MSEYFTLFATLLGLIVGSFLSMLIPRLHHEEEGIFFGRSHCMHCGATLSMRDLIPLLSFVLARGRARCCRKPVTFWYPAIEFSTALAFGGLSLLHSDPLLWAGQAALFSVLIFIFFYDLRFKEIHDAVMLPAILLALVIGCLSDWQSTLLGAALGWTFFALQYYASKGRWVGAGDQRIGAFMGAMLGIKLLPVGLFTAYICGSLVGIALIASGKAKRGATVALGPFLVTGTLIAYFYGQELIHWYINLI